MNRMAERYFAKKEKIMVPTEAGSSIAPSEPLRKESSEEKKAAKVRKQDRGDHLTATYWG